MKAINHGIDFVLGFVEEKREEWKHQCRGSRGDGSISRTMKILVYLVGSSETEDYQLGTENALYL